MPRKVFTVGGEDVHIDIHSHNAGGKGRTMAGRRKRKVSQKTLDALRRGREKLARMRGASGGKRKAKRAKSGAMRQINALRRKGRKIAKRAKIAPFAFTGKRHARKVRARSLSPIQGGTMAGRKRARRRRRARGFSGLGGEFGGYRRKRRRSRRLHGGYVAGGRRRSRRRRGGLLMGGMGGGMLGGIKRNLIPVVAGVAGAGASAFALSKLPGTMNPMLKAGIPLGAGLVAAAMSRNPMIRAVGMGAAIIGGYALARQALPNIVPSLSGVDETVDASLIGMGNVEALGDVRQLGMGEDVLGEDDGSLEGEDVLGEEDLDGEDVLGEDDGSLEGEEVEAL